MEVSLLKTLASKHKMSVKKIAEKYKATIKVQNKEYKALQVIVPQEGKEPLVATSGGIPLHVGHRTRLWTSNRPGSIQDTGQNSYDGC